MTKKYPHSISKETISTLPKEVFPGNIIVINQLCEAEEAIQYLSDYTEVGFDTETRPNFKKGRSNKISLMQISTEDVCFLFRLNIIDIPQSLADFLANENILKIGISVKNDFLSLRKRKEITTANFFELQQYVSHFGIEDTSLQKIYAILFNKRISKNQRLSNWDAEELSEAQIKYAALDAWACLKIYNQLKQGINETM
ncbi:MAG: 3'-5' exonuclease [Parabacteroides sp.]|nr:3'-5' exonuclease [Parabacteroides sp.]